MSALHIATSTIADGSMSAAVSEEQRTAHQATFLKAHDITLEQTILVKMSYDTDDFARFETVSVQDAGDGIIRKTSRVTDGLFTRDTNLALFLPVADCIAAVAHDPVQNVLGLVHLGRHNLEHYAGQKAIDYMRSEYDSRPSDITVYLGPSAGGDSYPLFLFNNQSLGDVAVAQLLSAEIQLGKIQIDPRDTTKDETLFSHSEYLRGNRSSDGRQALVAIMRPS